SRTVDMAPPRSSGSLLLTRKVSSVVGDDLLVLDTSRRRIHVLSSQAARMLEAGGEIAAVQPMRLSASATPQLVVVPGVASAPAVLRAAGATLVVTNTNDSGPGSLRQAILDADASPGADSMAFNILGPGPFTIAVS